MDGDLDVDKCVGLSQGHSNFLIGDSYILGNIETSLDVRKASVVGSSWSAHVGRALNALMSNCLPLRISLVVVFSKTIWP